MIISKLKTPGQKPALFPRSESNTDQRQQLTTWTMALPWKLELISFRPYFQHEHVHGPLTIRPSSIRLHLNASVRDRTVPWTWPLVWTLLLVVSEECLKGSWPERDCSSAVNRATLTTEPKNLTEHTVCHIYLCVKLQSPQDWLMHLLKRNVQVFLFRSICNVYYPFNQQSKLLGNCPTWRTNSFQYTRIYL